MRFKKGFTLVELLIVVLILGAMAAITIPRTSVSATNARVNACETNVDLMNSQIEMHYARTGSYPSSLESVTSDLNYFPEGAPVCPVGTSYTIDSNNRVPEHSH